MLKKHEGSVKRCATSYSEPQSSESVQLMRACEHTQIITDWADTCDELILTLFASVSQASCTHLSGMNLFCSCVFVYVCSIEILTLFFPANINK